MELEKFQELVLDKLDSIEKRIGKICERLARTEQEMQDHKGSVKSGRERTMIIISTGSILIAAISVLYTILSV